MSSEPQSSDEEPSLALMSSSFMSYVTFFTFCPPTAFGIFLSCTRASSIRKPASIIPAASPGPGWASAAAGALHGTSKSSTAPRSRTVNLQRYSSTKVASSEWSMRGCRFMRGASNSAATSLATMAQATPSSLNNMSKRFAATHCIFNMHTNGGSFKRT